MEIWKDIKGFRNIYQISNLGRIRRKDQRRVVTPVKLDNGLKAIDLFYTKHESQRFLVHELTARFFIENPNNYTHVRHKNGLLHDNKWRNLEWYNPDDTVLNEKSQCNAQE